MWPVPAYRAARSLHKQKGKLMSHCIGCVMFSFDHFSSAPPASITDSGAADSSDQAQAPVSAEVTASEAGGEATPSVTSEAAEAVSSDQASAEAEASDNSPDQSDTPAHAQ